MHTKAVLRLRSRMQEESFDDWPREREPAPCGGLDRSPV